MHLKILYTMKSVKQQIYKFYHVLHIKQWLYKNYHMHVLYKVCSLSKIKNLALERHLN
jgi:hypothetical protein